MNDRRSTRGKEKGEEQEWKIMEETERIEKEKDTTIMITNCVPPED